MPEPGGIKKPVVIAIAATILVAFAGVIGLPVLMVMMFASSGGAAAANGVGCVGGVNQLPGQPSIDEQVAGLSKSQMSNAYTIYLEGLQLEVSDFGVVVALATASQESGYQNYANDGQGGDLAADQQDIAESLDLPHDAVGTDHGSLGIFQQQYPWWGGMKDLMTPQLAAKKFYDALNKVPGWQNMDLTVAAQTVQSSAYPDAYADDEPLARQLLAVFKEHGESADVEDLLTVSETSPTAQCGSGDAMVCPQTDYPAEKGLTPDALRVLRCVDEEFGPHSYLGVGERTDNPGSDHTTGRAVDVMIDDWQRSSGHAEGTEIAHWVREHASRLGVTYVIWDAKIWSVERNAEGWRPYGHPSGATDPTSMHRDHVHVSVEGNAAGDGGANVGEDGAVLPLEAGTYTLTSPYGWRTSPTTGESELHGGQDFATDAGTPIKSTLAGKVTVAEWCDTCGFGYYVVVKSGNTEIYYAHQSKMRARVGDTVEPGDVIGEVGSTGNSTGNHLHFEVRVNGTAVDPIAWLEQRGLKP